MKLFIIRYLFRLVFEGEKTNSELSKDVGGTISNVSHAMHRLYALGLIKHPEGRTRSWIADHTKMPIKTIEKLLLIAKNDAEIKKLFLLPSVLKIGSFFYKNKKGTINDLSKKIGISKVTIIKALNKLITYGILIKKSGKPNHYYLVDTKLANAFLRTCSEILVIFINDTKKEATPKKIIERLKKDNNVLILIHYGSAAKGTPDSLSDIDLLAVTHDKMGRGEVLEKYSHKYIDLNVYSKDGFLRLLKNQPDFIRNIAGAKILKGKNIFEAIIQ
ncbi:MAG: nucleotidyltransferase domain-containing protein [Candidatus Jettenia sp. CY-1]|nr:nucleotidyltransferase domain-containing protein [Candidatus Jettenia sp.]WKZ19607.1 MAG: nucleotidyltransferase domain-containing protein [Candidatus Jettenia sp. CY-1]